jgi:hypothetical protein
MLHAVAVKYLEYTFPAKLKLVGCIVGDNIMFTALLMHRLDYSKRNCFVGLNSGDNLLG